MKLERATRLLQRLEGSKIASICELVGCSENEIAILESRYGLCLPQSYRWYLGIMGHQSGRLFKCDHMALSYPFVLDLTARQRQTWAERTAEGGSGPPPSFQLPSDSLLIASRLGDQFEFIRCNDPDDSPVWYFNNWDWQTQEAHPTILAWLESWCEECEEAITDCYFNTFPDGPTP
jgi:hypothetical protein